MPIHVPGKRNRHGRLKTGKRSAVAALNMTAMVDMFTVLCGFLLQNYATTNQVLPMPDKVELPAAHETKELKPSNVVVVATDGIVLNNIKVAEFLAVKEQKDWLIKPLVETLQKSIQEGEAKKQSVGSQIRSAVNEAKHLPKTDETDDFRKLTIQADKNVDFLTIKKVMFSITEAGIAEINFAVTKKENAAGVMGNGGAGGTGG
jgi:biopolymer transport protein ExbD